MSLLQLLSVPLLIAINAFFVAAEYAVVAARPQHIDALRRAGRKSAAEALATLKNQAGSTIGTIQVCITLTNLLLGWLGEPAMVYLLGRLFGSTFNQLPEAVSKPLAITLSFFFVTLFTVVFSELVPKAITLRQVPRTAAITAQPILAIAQAVRPLVWVMNTMANMVTIPLGFGRVDEADGQRVTTAEIRSLTTAAAEDGELTSRERSVILNALTLADRKVQQVMVPRVRVIHLDLKYTMDENRQIINERLYSRLPLCDGGMDHVVGVLHTKEFLTAHNAAGDVSVLSLIARDPVFVPETNSMDKLLSLFIEKRSQMVIVLDEYGGVSGIATLRDTVDSLLGGRDAIMNEAAGRTGDAPRSGKLTVAGDMPKHDLAQRLEIHDWAMMETAVTVGGLIQDNLGHMPSVGESIEVEGVRLRVTGADSRRVLHVEVTPPSVARTEKL